MIVEPWVHIPSGYEAAVSLDCNAVDAGAHVSDPIKKQVTKPTVF
jgi:hypothetical protein